MQPSVTLWVTWRYFVQLPSAATIATQRISVLQLPYLRPGLPLLRAVLRLQHTPSGKGRTRAIKMGRVLYLPVDGSTFGCRSLLCHRCTACPVFWHDSSDYFGVGGKISWLCFMDSLKDKCWQWSTLQGGGRFWVFFCQDNRFLLLFF